MGTVSRKTLGQFVGVENSTTSMENISATLNSVQQGIGSLTSDIGAAKSCFERALLPAVQVNNLGGGISAFGDIPGPSQFLSLNYSESIPQEPIKKALTDPTLNSQEQLKTLLGSLKSINPQNYLSGESLGQFEQFQKALLTATKQFNDLQTQMMTKIGA
jgi:hypothetical protein